MSDIDINPQYVAVRLTELRALQAAEARTKWLPIETAPKDGTDILATDGYSKTAIRWRVLTERYQYWELCVAGAYAEDAQFDDPTHWMPLPIFNSQAVQSDP